MRNERLPDPDSSLNQMIPSSTIAKANELVMEALGCLFLVTVHVIKPPQCINIEQMGDIFSETCPTILQSSAWQLRHIDRGDFQFLFGSSILCLVWCGRPCRTSTASHSS